MESLITDSCLALNFQDKQDTGSTIGTIEALYATIRMCVQFCFQLLDSIFDYAFLPRVTSLVDMNATELNDPIP